MESPRLSAAKQLEPFKQPPEAERVVGVLSLGCMFGSVDLLDKS